MPAYTPPSLKEIAVPSHRTAGATPAMLMKGYVCGNCASEARKDFLAIARAKLARTKTDTRVEDDDANAKAASNKQTLVIEQHNGEMHEEITSELHVSFASIMMTMAMTMTVTMSMVMRMTMRMVMMVMM
eukprot:10816308-Karenia_brevis.AAC.1